MLRVHYGMKQIAALLLSAALAACASPSPERGVEAATVVPKAGTWQAVILPEDRQRLENLDSTWQRALEVTAYANADLVAQEGALLQPGEARRAVPEIGTYRCRTIKLGMEQLGGIAYDWFRCRVFDDEGQVWVVKETGSQRQTGRIFADGVFLGGTLLGEEQGGIAYGAITDRNVVAVVERLGQGHYRLVQPQPYYESALDILELKAG
jgi:hypothetical protein|tara:strand:+ start:79483 stop:80109 length:627 start_codon:yes stop_codon:yes gene_type:complete